MNFAPVTAPSASALWNARHPEKLREASRKWRAKNKEKVKQLNADWQAANKDRVSALNKRWVAENKERRRELTDAWYARNPGAATAYANKRRAAKLNATPPWVDLKEIAAIYRRAAEAGMTVDHIYPLQHPRCCGLHVPWNLQLLSFSENARKGNRLPCH